MTAEKKRELRSSPTGKRGSLENWLPNKKSNTQVTVFPVDKSKIGMKAGDRFLWIPTDSAKNALGMRTILFGFLSK
jgi:hypothetical protein